MVESSCALLSVQFLCSELVLAGYLWSHCVAIIEAVWFKSLSMFFMIFRAQGFLSTDLFNVRLLCLVNGNRHNVQVGLLLEQVF